MAFGDTRYHIVEALNNKARWVLLPSRHLAAILAPSRSARHGLLVIVVPLCFCTQPTGPSWP